MNIDTNETICFCTIILAAALVLASINLGGCGVKTIRVEVEHIQPISK